MSHVVVVNDAQCDYVHGSAMDSKSVRSNEQGGAFAMQRSTAHHECASHAHEHVPHANKCDAAVAHEACGADAAAHVARSG